MCFSVQENIAPQIRLVTAFMVCYSSLTELLGVERNRKNTTSILLNGVHLFVHFISWFLVVGYLHIPIFVTALVKVTINILLLVVSIIVKGQSKRLYSV